MIDVICEDPGDEREEEKVSPSQIPVIILEKFSNIYYNTGFK